ncbi:MAG: ABC transporter substrate-binding protein [Candidatus Saccharibacteria bacterium]|nr:ABC transporter substrate-binding protein [Candidatus Saccharibacteria bacterium]
MVNSFQKRGRRIVRKFSRASIKASEKSNERIRKNFIERISHVRNVRLLVFEWGLLVVALIMLALTQAFWFGDSYAEDVYVVGGTYTEATIGEVDSLNPLFATTNSEKVLSKLMFATISTIDYSGHPGNQLAQSITASEDGQKWTVKLREGLKWSDGEPLTNEDVIFTTELIQNPAVSTIYAANLAGVKVSENENGEIVFDLPSAYADFISALNIPIVPKHILGDTDPKTLIENSFSNAPITSGAFNYNAAQSGGNDGEKIYYLSANPNYYLGRPMINSFAVHTYESKDNIVDAINTGAVTATAELSGTDTEKITASQFNERLSCLNSGAFIFFNVARKSVSNVETRSAIRQAIDLNKIRDLALGTTKLDFPLIDSQIQIAELPKLPERDFEAAKAKIAELNGEEKIHLDVATVNAGFLPGVSNILKEDLEALGFEVNVSVYEENQEFINNVVSKRSYDILIYEIELGADPDLLPYYHSSQASSAGLNLSNYKNALVDDLLLGARDTMALDLRTKKYEAFLQYWATDIPAIGLYRPNLTYLYNKNVRTFSNNVRLVTPIDRFADINDWAVTKATKNKTP